MAYELPPPVSHRRAWIAATAAFLAHNVEEAALDLAAWTETQRSFPWLGWMGPPGVFDSALAIISLAVCVLAIYAIATGPGWSPRRSRSSRSSCWSTRPATSC